MARQGAAGLGGHGRARRGPARPGMAVEVGCGGRGAARLGAVGPGKVGPGTATLSGYCMARYDG